MRIISPPAGSGSRARVNSSFVVIRHVGNKLRIGRVSLADG